MKNHAVLGEMLGKEVRFPRSEIFHAALVRTVPVINNNIIIELAVVSAKTSLKAQTQHSRVESTLIF